MWVSRRAILWGLAAVTGIALTAGVAWSASRIAGEHVGLSGEPLSVARGLAPASTPSGRRPAAATQRRTFRVHVGSPPPAVTSVATAPSGATTTASVAVTPSSAPSPPAATPNATTPNATTATATVAAAATAPSPQRSSPAHNSGGEDNGGGGGGGRDD